MGYRIEYDSGKKQYEIHHSEVPRFSVMLVGALLMFLFLTVAFWPEGTALLRDVLIPGEDAVTLQALESMAQDLRCGTSVSDAVTAFCREIIHGPSHSG